MKLMKKIVLTTMCLAAIEATIAAEVDEGNVTNFQSGQPALASEVNGTFAALISAINDNATRIAAIEDASNNNSLDGKTFSFSSTEVGVASSNDGTFGFARSDICSFSGTIAFSTASTGTITQSDNCAELVLNSGNTRIELLDPESGDESFTYIQSGNTVTLTFPDPEDGSLELVVSADGSILIGALFESEDEPENGATASSSIQNFIVGLQQ